MKRLQMYAAPLMVSCLFSCGKPIIHSWVQSPLHPLGNGDITLQATAQARSNIRSATLTIYEFQLRDAGFGALDLTPTDRTPIIQTFDQLQSRSIDLSHTFSGTPSGTRVLFTVEVRNQFGETAFKMASFDVGDPPSGFPILLYNSSNHPSERRIDVCFVPDKDYQGDFSRYCLDIDGMIRNGYLQSNALRGHEESWAFFTTHLEGDIRTSPASIPEEIASNTFFDAVGLVHASPVRDGAAGKVFTTEAVNIGTAVHEAGHSVFSLRDEYCSSGRTSCSVCRIAHCNRYATEEACRDYNRAQGFPEDCRACLNDATPCFFPEPDSLRCIMLQDGNRNLPDFQRTCIQRTHAIYLDFNDN